MYIIDKLKKWFEPMPNIIAEPPPPPKAPPTSPSCEHNWHEFKNRDGEIKWRECRKCWSRQTWNNHWTDVRIW